MQRGREESARRNRDETREGHTDRTSGRSSGDRGIGRILAGLARHRTYPYSDDVGGGDVVVSAIDPVGSMQSIDKERLSLLAGKVRSMLADAVAEA